MNKLTAEECRLLINGLSGNRSIREDKYLQALEIALPVLEQQEKEAATQIDNDVWIEWGGGERPLAADVQVEVRFRDGEVIPSDAAIYWEWVHHQCAGDIIAYRVIDNDGREG